MNAAPQEMLKEYVQSQHFTSTAEIMSAMKEMFRDVVQTVMEVEMDEELGRERCQRAETSSAPNYRNGYTKKTVKTQLGEVDIRVPRDQKRSFEPKIIRKYSRNADGMEEKILALYSCGMSQRDIAEQIKAAYVVLGITMDGRKDILGVWIGEHERSKFWLNVLNNLKSRGVMDVYLFCTDGLCGMMETIHAVYPQRRLQRCIVHQIRSSTRFVSWKDSKQFWQDVGKFDAYECSGRSRHQ